MTAYLCGDPVDLDAMAANNGATALPADTRWAIM